MSKRRPAIERFWDRVSPEPNSGCWLWTGSADRKGYGNFSEKGKATRAHRWSYQHFVGPIPTDFFVCHRCDVPSCVNPDHLYAGTIKDNVADMCRRGRHAWQTDPASKARGERHGLSKMTSKQVIAIRRAHSRGRPGLWLAKEHCVAHSTIFDIVNRITWTHLPANTAPQEAGDG